MQSEKFLLMFQSVVVSLSVMVIEIVACGHFVLYSFVPYTLNWLYFAQVDCTSLKVAAECHSICDILFLSFFSPLAADSFNRAYNYILYSCAYRRGYIFGEKFSPLFLSQASISSLLLTCSSSIKCSYLCPALQFLFQVALNVPMGRLCCLSVIAGSLLLVALLLK